MVSCVGNVKWNRVSMRVEKQVNRCDGVSGVGHGGVMAEVV